MLFSPGFLLQLNGSSHQLQNTSSVHPPVFLPDEPEELDQHHHSQLLFRLIKSSLHHDRGVGERAAIEYYNVRSERNNNSFHLADLSVDLSHDASNENLFMSMSNSGQWDYHEKGRSDYSCMTFYGAYELGNPFFETPADFGDEDYSQFKLTIDEDDIWKLKGMEVKVFRPARHGKECWQYGENDINVIINDENDAHPSRGMLPLRYSNDENTCTIDYTPNSPTGILPEIEVNSGGIRTDTGNFTP